MSPPRCALVISVWDISGFSKMSPSSFTAGSLLHQAADSDDDHDLVEFVGQAGVFNLTAHPEGRETEFNGVVGDIDITTYGELNLVAEPQKVRTHVVTELLAGQVWSKTSTPQVVLSPETAVSLVQDLLGLLLDALFPDESWCKRKELKIKGLAVR